MILVATLITISTLLFALLASSGTRYDRSRLFAFLMQPPSGSEPRRAVPSIPLVLVLGIVLTCLSIFPLFIGIVLALFLSSIAFIYWQRYKQQREEQKLLYETPVALESLILLVESGLGLLPSIERLGSANLASRVLRSAYDRVEEGVPFGQALASEAEAQPHPLLRHVLLHLDIAGNDGGELIPALRSLSEHAHTEWRLSVEQRIKRLENLVVFPVFLSVIGLIFLLAAVPLVPVLDFRDSMKQQSAQKLHTQE